MAISKLKYWCYKVLPLVYDDSLSYYEQLCKVVGKLNEIIDVADKFSEQYQEIQDAIAELQNQIDEIDTSYIEGLIKQWLGKMILPFISDAGYIVYNIPEQWSDITFNTTGLDITDKEMHENGMVGSYDYGRLVLSMWV